MKLLQYQQYRVYESAAIPTVQSVWTCCNTNSTECMNLLQYQQYKQYRVMKLLQYQQYRVYEAAAIPTVQSYESAAIPTVQSVWTCCNTNSTELQLFSSNWNILCHIENVFFLSIKTTKQFMAFPEHLN